MVPIVRATVLRMSLFRQFLLKKSNVNTLIRRVNDILNAFCVIYGFGFTCKAIIMTKYLYRMMAKYLYLYRVLSSYLFSNSHNHF